MRLSDIPPLGVYNSSSLAGLEGGMKWAGGSATLFKLLVSSSKIFDNSVIALIW